MDRMLLVLDIDEVLVYSAENVSSVSQFDFTVDRYKVIVRPYVSEFLEFVIEQFDLAIWTHGTRDYAFSIIKRLFADVSVLKFVWSRERCTYRRDFEMRDFYCLKDLKKVKRKGFRLERVLVIDDDPRSLQRNYGNLITVLPFEGNLLDQELKSLIPFLYWISRIEDVRKINKRNWRERQYSAQPKLQATRLRREQSGADLI